MIGVIIITHSELASGFRKTLEHVIGPLEQLEIFEVEPDDDLDARREELSKLISEVDSGQGVILLTDMFGGSPSNLAISLFKEHEVEIVAGVNVPMLIKLMGSRQSGELKNAAEDAAIAGRKYINFASNSFTEDEIETSRAVREIDQRLTDFILVSPLVENQLEALLQQIKDEIPNSFEAKQKQENLIDLLESILNSLRDISKEIRILLHSLENIEEKHTIIDEKMEDLSGTISSWWGENRADAVDWCIRFPAMGAAIGLLNLAGATPSIATGAAIAAIGGPKLYTIINKAK